LDADEFRVKVIGGKGKINRDIAAIIAEKVWNELGSRDIRDVIKVARLVTNQEDVSFVVKMLKKRISKSQYCACGNKK